MGRKRTSTKRRTSISIERDLHDDIEYIVEKLGTNKSVFFSDLAKEYIAQMQKKRK